MKSPKKLKKLDNLKDEIKIMNKFQIQKKQKAASVRDNNQNVIKELENTKRELEKQFNRHRNNINRYNGHQTVQTKDNA